MAAVTIGIPVFNEGRFIDKTLCSVDGQADCIIISDNASTDDTSEICREFASGRPYVRYHRFDENEGALANFMWCLDNAETDYFMWVGGHDIIDDNHVDNLRRTLEETKAVQAYANSAHFDANYKLSWTYDYPFAHLLASEHVVSRIMGAAMLTECSIYHGLYLRNVIALAMKRSYGVNCLPLDHVALMEVARIGKMSLCEATRYVRLDPERKETNQAESWERAIRALLGKRYDPEQHPARLFPYSVYNGQAAIIKGLRHEGGFEDDVLGFVLHYIMQRWGWCLQPGEML